MNYQELVDTSIAYADRHDVEVADNIDTFIILTEARVNRLLKTREQSARAYAPTIDDEEFYSLPPDYAGMRDFQLNSDSPLVEHNVTNYEMMSPEQMNVQGRKSYHGTLYYCILANQIQIFPKQAAGQTIEMTYYQKVPSLNAGATINWLSESHPDIYVAGMTAEIELFAKNYDAADGWFGRMKIAVSELDSADVKERWAGNTLVTRVG